MIPLVGQLRASLTSATPGPYNSTSIGEVEVLEDGRLVVAGQRQYLAGASLPMTVGIGKIMQYAGVELAEAITMSTTRPAACIGIHDVQLAVGAPADLILFDLPTNSGDPICVRSTINAGETVWQA